MKLNCELCGSSNIVKESDVFVCQNCGVRYTTEQAKKLLNNYENNNVENNNVDVTKDISVYLDQARQSKAASLWTQAMHFYEQVEQLAPTNLEASIYSAYCNAFMSLGNRDMKSRVAQFNKLNEKIVKIPSLCNRSDFAETKSVIECFANDLIRMFKSNFEYTWWIIINVRKDNRAETYELFIQIMNTFYSAISIVEANRQEKELYGTLITFLENCKNCEFTGSCQKHLNEIKSNNDERLDTYINKQITELNLLKSKLFDQYWIEHADEKRELEKELNELTIEIEDLSKQIATMFENCKIVPSMKRLEKKQEEILLLKQQKKGVRIFDFSKRKELSAQKRILVKEKKEINKDIKVEQQIAFEKTKEQTAPMDLKLNTMKNRVEDINNELTKER